MLRVGKKVWITSGRKTDGRYNRGIIVGIEKTYHGLGYLTEKQYLSSFELSRYKVAYVDVVTGHGVSEWLLCDEVSDKNPKAVDN